MSVHDWHIIGYINIKLDTDYTFNILFLFYQARLFKMDVHYYDDKAQHTRGTL